MSKLLLSLSVVVFATAAAALTNSTDVQFEGSEFRVNSYTQNHQDGAQVDHDAQGNLVVVWCSYYQDGSGYGIYGQQYDRFGMPLGSEFRVSTYSYWHQMRPSVACAPTGEFVVAWQSDRQDPNRSIGVYAQRFDSSGAKIGGEFRVNTFYASTQYTPDVAVAWTASGGFVITWTSYTQDGSSYGVYGQRYTSSGSPLGGEFRVNATTLGSQSYSIISIDPDGNFVIVWVGQDDDASGVYGQMYESSGALVGSEFLVNTTTAGSQTIPCVTHDPWGNFLVVWESDDGSAGGIFGQRFDPAGARVGPEFRINTYTDSRQGHVSVACDPSGNYVAAWFSEIQDDGTTGVYGQAIDNSGNLLGSEFRVSSFTPGTQRTDYSSHHVSFGPDGEFVIVWQSDGQDGSGWGVYGQRFASLQPPMVALSGTIVSDCDGPLAGVSVTLAHPAGSFETTSDDQGFWSFEVPATSDAGSVSITVPGGYETAESSLSCAFNEDTSGIDFTLGCVYVSVTGTVSADCAGALATTVDLTYEDTFLTTTTDASGAYIFAGLRWTETPGEVSLVTPLGFSCNTPLDGHAAVSFTEDATMSFALTCVQATGVVRSMGYWKHQARVYMYGRGNAQESEPDMTTGFAQAIYSHFYTNDLNAIRVEGVSCVVTEAGDSPLELETIETTLTVNKGGTMLDRAKQHYLALLLNIASGKLMTHTVVSVDGFTASQALQDVADRINFGDANGQEIAKDIAETINDAMLVPAGVIRDQWDSIAYKQVAPSERFALAQNVPNPFNPVTHITFNLPESGRYALSVYDASGRLVRRFADVGTQGQNEVVWNGCNQTGREMPSGVYFYVLATAQHQATRKMTVLR